MTAFPKLTPTHRAEIVDMVTSGRKSSAEAARIFAVHPATISHLLAQARRLACDPEQILR
jgi:DNA-binding CsgD family transcriptional regulator